MRRPMARARSLARAQLRIPNRMAPAVARSRGSGALAVSSSRRWIAVSGRAGARFTGASADGLPLNQARTGAYGGLDDEAKDPARPAQGLEEAAGDCAALVISEVAPSLPFVGGGRGLSDEGDAVGHSWRGC